jgi:hypothetical protein
MSLELYVDERVDSFHDRLEELVNQCRKAQKEYFNGLTQEEQAEALAEHLADWETVREKVPLPVDLEFKGQEYSLLQARPHHSAQYSPPGWSEDVMVPENEDVNFHTRDSGDGFLGLKLDDKFKRSMVAEALWNWPMLKKYVTACRPTTYVSTIQFIERARRYAQRTLVEDPHHLKAKMLITPRLSGRTMAKSLKMASRPQQGAESDGKSAGSSQGRGGTGSHQARGDSGQPSGAQPRRSGRQGRYQGTYSQALQADGNRNRQGQSDRPRPPASWPCKICSSGEKHYRDQCPRWIKMLELEKAAGGRRVHALNTSGESSEQKAHSSSAPPTDTSTSGTPSTNAVSAKTGSQSAQQGSGDGETNKGDATLSKSARRKLRKKQQKVAAVEGPRSSTDEIESKLGVRFAPLCDDEDDAPASDDEPTTESAEAYARAEISLHAITLTKRRPQIPAEQPGPSPQLMANVEDRLEELRGHMANLKLLRAHINQISSPETLQVPDGDQDPLLESRLAYEKDLGLTGKEPECKDAPSIAMARVKPQADVTTTLFLAAGIGKQYQELPTQTLLDTGSEIVVVRASAVPSQLTVHPLVNCYVNGFTEGTSREVKGEVYLKIRTPCGKAFPTTKALVLDDLNYPLILGKEWLTKNRMQWSMRPSGDVMTLLTRQGRVSIKSEAHKMRSLGRLSVMKRSNSSSGRKDAKETTPSRDGDDDLKSAGSPVTLNEATVVEPRQVRMLKCQVPKDTL